MTTIRKLAVGLAVAVFVLLVLTKIDYIPSHTHLQALVQNDASEQYPQATSIPSHRSVMSTFLSSFKKHRKTKQRSPTRKPSNEDVDHFEKDNVQSDLPQTKTSNISKPEQKSTPQKPPAISSLQNILDIFKKDVTKDTHTVHAQQQEVKLSVAATNKDTNQPVLEKATIEKQPIQASKPLGNTGSNSILKAANYPQWWTEAWSRSSVFPVLNQFVGDRPLFQSCGVDPPQRSTYTFVEPEPYLPKSVTKNPCWYQIPRAKKGLRCVPYVYLAGVAKCGTSDIAKRLRAHPEVFEGTNKEYHWWERDRFGKYDEENPEKTVNVHGGKSFKDYTQQITGKGITELSNELNDKGSSVRIFGDYSPSYLWDPQNWYALDGNQGCKEPRVIVGQHIRHVYPDAKLIFTFRHPTPRLYSRFMSRIHRTPELKKATVNDFHHYVSEGIALYKTCFDRWSIRHCAYNKTVYKDSMVRLVEGMYPVFMADWLRVWPRHQIFVMRYEDYGGHERERIQELIDFLGLRTLNKTAMDKLMEIDIVNSGSEEYEKYGSMLPQTKQLLDDFYQPFNQQFAQMLNDPRFLWKDVYQ